MLGSFGLGDSGPSSCVTVVLAGGGGGGRGVLNPKP